MRYLTHGTCSRAIEFSVNEEGILESVEFEGGCRGNTEGVARLCIGRKAEEIIPLLRGIPCRGNTSCPDQLAKALSEYLAKKQ